MRGSSFWRSKRAVFLIVLVVILLAAGLVAAWAYKHRQTHNVRGSASTEFVSTAAPGHKRTRVIASELPWPTYGLDEQRTRLVTGTKVRPPYGTHWVYKAKSLLEFPPAIAYHYVYLPIERGYIRALQAWNGKLVWSRKFNACIAASPAVAKGVVYESLLNPCSQEHTNKPGAVVALDAQTGKTVWKATIGATESSPLTGKDRHGLVVTDEEIDACLFRMLQWPELLRAQQMHAHPDGRPYELTAERRDKRGRVRELSNEQRVKMIGNAVSSPVAAMLGSAVAEILEEAA
jgi:hypothetical protein